VFQQLTRVSELPADHGVMAVYCIAPLLLLLLLPLPLLMMMMLMTLMVVRVDRFKRFQ